MSHAVVRGRPLPAQLYLDSILDEILSAQGRPLTVSARRGVGLAQIFYHCLQKKPQGVFMINGHTEEVITNEQILKDALSLARALLAKGARGKTVMLLMRNHQRMAATYLAVLFAQTLPFMQDPNTTAFEVTHFLKLIEPRLVFCEEDHRETLTSTLAAVPDLQTEVVLMETETHLHQFTRGNSRDVGGFEIPDRDPESAVMLLPTSGSTGLPKAALMTEQGLIAQLPGCWMYHTQFPSPTALAMMLSTAQWMTFTMTITSVVTYHIPLLVTPKTSSVEVVKDLLIKFRPTWTFFGPTFVKTLLPEITADHFSSLKTLTLVGAPVSMNMIAALQDLLPNDGQLCDGYGTTEAQGYIALPDRGAPLKSNGRVLNIFHYKLLDSKGKEVGLCQNGELYVKGVSCIQGYYKNAESYAEAFTDGWYRTGDLFYVDENECLSYLQRIKFIFESNGYEVSPEEVEAVISSVEGVQQCVVVDSKSGPAAAVVLLPDRTVTATQIHKAVDANLSEHKRLRGGVAFLPALPHTPSGKLRRGDCRRLVRQLIAAGAMH